MLHELKILPIFFEPLKSNQKKFEVRKNDRPFKVGDEILFRELHPNHRQGFELEVKYSSEICHRKISYILSDFEGIERGFCVLGLENL